MRSLKSGLVVFMAAAVLWVLSFTNSVSAQNFYNPGQQRLDYPTSRPGNIIIGKDKNVTWEGPENSIVYIQVDYEAPRILAVGRSGVLSVAWITSGHLYVFSLRDPNGKEIARDQQDLRKTK